MQRTNSQIDISYLISDDYPLWDEFVKSSPQGTFFNTIKWVDLLSSIYQKPFRILACRKQSEIQAGIVFFENRRFIWKMITPVFLFPFNGPLFGEVTDVKYQKSIAGQLKYSHLLIEQLQKDYNFIMLDTYYNINDMRSFQWESFNVEPVYSYMCKLENEEHLNAGFNQTLRKKIRKSIEHDARMIESNDLDLFISFYETSYTRHNQQPPVKLSVIKIVLEKIIQLENVHLYFAEFDGKLVAGRIILEDDQTIYDLLAGNIDESGLASSFLVAEIMKKYLTNSSYFDFLGAGHPEIEKFKRGFGGDLMYGFRAVSHASFPLSLMIKLRRSGLQAGRRL